MPGPSRNYMVTVFFPESGLLSQSEQCFLWASNLTGSPDSVFSDPIYKYAIFNIEVCPETHRPHWQMYVELNLPARPRQLQRSHPVFATAHYEPRLGTQSEAIAYCSKTDSRHPMATGPYEYGTKSPGQGHRSDLDDLTSAIVEGKSTREIAETMPGMYIKFHHGIAALQAALQEDFPPETNFKPRPWQQTVIDNLTQPPDDRHIYWITDTQGNQGKTRLATHLIRNYGGIELSGKMADMTYAYMQTVKPVPGEHKGAPIVIFDVSRAMGENTDHLYSMAEKLKSGRIFNTKWQSRQVMFTPPHVIFFSNQTWNKTKLSIDRVKETVLQAPQEQPILFM